MYRRFYISAIFRSIFAVRIVIISPTPGAVVFFHQLAFAYSFLSKDHSKGIGYAAWCEVEKLYPQVTLWETVTPYFEKRNIHS
jgi:hypothetical protein